MMLPPNMSHSSSPHAVTPRDRPPEEEEGDIKTRVSVAYNLVVQDGVNTRSIPSIRDHPPIQEEGGILRPGQNEHPYIAQEGENPRSISSIRDHTPIQEEVNPRSIPSIPDHPPIQEEVNLYRNLRPVQNERQEGESSLWQQVLHLRSWIMSFLRFQMFQDNSNKESELD
ncbi:hypothetical protein XELAEV_18036496mg [Xenopus laevis]|uniref:Uncharacterized protein n=1 Tax=Xenopus laevis TaxID=8355 RepID=A0A974HD20_XENLA|nr:hypothetical protein XELAEV_18036496mg [Xenopus laevis]